MNKNPDECKEKNADRAIDCILGSEDELAPSSGFLAAVMERVEKEAAAPVPIPFPWLRILPGLTLVLAAFCWGVYALADPFREALGSLTFSTPQIAVNAHNPAMQAAPWVAAAMGVSLFTWLLCRRLTGRGGLL